MYLRIGGRKRPFNEVKSPVISYRLSYDPYKRVSTIEETWQLSGRIVLQTNATQRNMTTAINLLKEDLFASQRPDLVFLEDDGVTPSAFQLLASNTFEGPLLTEHSFPSDAADVYATGVMWAAVFTAKRLPAGTNNPLIEFAETVANPSGGRIEGMVGGAINFPERQVFKENEPYVYIQSGRSVGLLGYPDPPPPLWPAFQTRRNKPVLMSPRIPGPPSQEFEIQWEYEFMSETPLLGIPHTY